MDSAEVEKSSRKGWVVLSVVGLALVVLITAFSPYLAYMMHTSNPCDWGFFPLAGVVVYFILCSLNALLVKFRGSPLLDPAQTLAFFFILTMGSWASTWAFNEALMPLLTSPWVFATPQNGWQEIILPHLHKLIMGPSEEPWASAFWDGLPQGASIPWRLWVVPIAIWTSFAVMLFVFSISLAGFLGRHWIEHDRLAFPHAEVVMGMARDFMSNKLFWWGVATAAAVPSWNLMCRFFPVFPPISLYFGGGGSQGVEWLTGADRLVLVLDFMVLGLFYFVHRDIVLSMALFFFVIAIEKRLISLTGIQLEYGDLFGGKHPVNWQSTGALMAFVLFGLWSSRRWLFDYLKDAWKGTGWEKSWIPPRWNVVAFIVSVSFLFLWVGFFGLSGRGLVAFIFAKILLYIGLARIVAESAIEAWMDIRPHDFVVLLGTKHMAPAAFVALGMAFCWLTDSQLSLASRMTQTERMRTSFVFPRRFLLVLFASVAVSVVTAMCATLYVAYTYAANNFGNWSFGEHARDSFSQIIECARISTGFDWVRMFWVAIGACIVALLVFLRNNVVGWALHPIGFVVAGGARAANKIVFMCLLAWAVKTLLLKLGGVYAYEKYKPYFAGLVVGAFLPWILGMFLDPVFFPRRGMAMPLINY